MSLAKKIVLITAAVIAALTVSGMTVYKLIIVPKYIEPLLDSAAEMMKDSDVQDTVTSIAKDLADRGVLDENTFREYIKKSRKYTGSSTTSGSSDDMPVSGERINTSSIYDENVSGEETDKENLGSSLGIERARVLEKSDTSEAKVNESYSKRFNENNSSDGDWIENGRYTLDDAVSGEKINTADKSRASRLYDKIVGSMSISERKVFFGVIGKADTNKLLELRNDKQGAKEYLQSILDNDEYSEAVAIFYKYVPLLYEE